MTDYPWFRWFAWHPVSTTDRGWRWLCMVQRRRVVSISPAGPTYRWFDHKVR